MRLSAIAALAALAATLFISQVAWADCVGDEIRLTVSSDLNAYDPGEPVEITVASLNLTDSVVACSGPGHVG